MVTDRGLEVLRAIVQDYVASSEPVGSKSIVERHSFGVSAATIRNDMALLEEAELIVAPHTSSGRIPTDKGYRVFVDRLQGMQPLSPAQRQAIARFLGEADDLDDVMARSVRLLSQLTNQVALAQYPSVAKARVRRIEVVQLAQSRLLLVVILDSGRVEQRTVDAGQQLEATDAQAIGRALDDAVGGKPTTEAEGALVAVVDGAAPAVATATQRLVAALGEVLEPTAGDRLVIAGASHLVRGAADMGSLTLVLEAIEEQVTLLRLFGEMDAEERSVATRIGREMTHGLEETSIVTGAYGAGGHEAGRVGVLGPTRMDYASNMAAVRAVARYLTRLLDDEER
ncbi:heat-inducible transcriptional repressor HrcA [Agrococcus sp. SGAir0287]|uniref:heat-inducible transcriptional repressor HrcA n=1 Tax=Agrococcus sp. SGAir0287 TaxID=2070347 RepID=UPI0010CCEB2B|nr:heat-inducible transcriptional repressor HrcA [Agrococcus sp. SGAir0287]QCR19454.1 heat-inducible transcriptional repressor HrcA [Agrococcus sp. SGAir0287]